MADYKEAFKKTARWEGQYQNNPADNANYCNGKLIGTMRGVSAIGFKATFGHCPTVAEIKAITAEQARDVFKRMYWDAMQADHIADQSVAEMVADWGWGSGPFTALVKVQRVLRVLGHRDVVADGKMGPHTLNALNTHPAEELHAALWAAREAHFRAIAEANPGKRQFLAGWLNRLRTFTYDGAALVRRAFTRAPPGATTVALLLLAGLLYWLYRSAGTIPHPVIG